MAPIPLIVRTLAVLACLTLCAAMPRKKAAPRARLQAAGVERTWAAPPAGAAWLPGLPR